MRFKKIYLEITNRCNLSCDFCIKNHRKVTCISRDQFSFIVAKIKPYTDELYLHVLGEPLIHDDINYFIDYASSMGLMVNITTNGYLIMKIKDNKNIHRLNISLHSFSDKYKIDIDTYLEQIFKVIDNIRDKTFVTLRLWQDNEYTQRILDYINNRYKTNISELDKNKKVKIVSNLMIDTFHPFIWPDMNNDYYSEEGSCYGLRNHIGILSDGTIIPCCLDTLGIIKLGNIYQDDIDDVMDSKLVKEMIDGFKHNYKCHVLCRHCKFLD